MAKAIIIIIIITTMISNNTISHTTVKCAPVLLHQGGLEGLRVVSWRGLDYVCMYVYIYIYTYLHMHY